MPSPTRPAAPDVVAVGHAIVDVLAYSADDQVRALGLVKGTMTLVDDDRSDAVYRAVAPDRVVSGGSAANTAVGLASLGASAAFVGKVRDDELGDVFVRDIRAAGVGFDVAPAESGPGTGRCVVMVTPDAEKTMCTSLGVGDLLGVADVEPGLIASAQVLYLEGYLCGLEHTDATVAAALDAAGAAATTVALSLSDPFWVELHGAELAALLPRVGMVFANEQEACLLTGTPDARTAVAVLGERVETVVVTLGAAGSIVASGGRRVEVAAQAAPDVVDTTGAGDLYAAGFLFGHVRGADIETSARLGSLAAAEAVGHLGARPLTLLRDLAAAASLV